MNEKPESPPLYEIENARYLAAAFFVLPLSDGRIAVLTPRRDLFKVVDDWNEALRVGPLAEAAVTKRQAPLQDYAVSSEGIDL